MVGIQMIFADGTESPLLKASKAELISEEAAVSAENSEERNKLSTRTIPIDTSKTISIVSVF